MEVPAILDVLISAAANLNLKAGLGQTDSRGRFGTANSEQNRPESPRLGFFESRGGETARMNGFPRDFLHAMLAAGAHLYACDRERRTAAEALRTMCATHR